MSLTLFKALSFVVTMATDRTRERFAIYAAITSLDASPGEPTIVYERFSCVWMG